MALEKFYSQLRLLDPSLPAGIGSGRILQKELLSGLQRLFDNPIDAVSLEWTKIERDRIRTLPGLNLSTYAERSPECKAIAFLAAYDKTQNDAWIFNTNWTDADDIAMLLLPFVATKTRLRNTMNTDAALALFSRENPLLKTNVAKTNLLKAWALHLDWNGMVSSPFLQHGIQAGLRDYFVTLAAMKPTASIGDRLKTFLTDSNERRKARSVDEFDALLNFVGTLNKWQEGTDTPICYSASYGTAFWKRFGGTVGENVPGVINPSEGISSFIEASPMRRFFEDRQTRPVILPFYSEAHFPVMMFVWIGRSPKLKAVYLDTIGSEHRRKDFEKVVDKMKIHFKLDVDIIFPVTHRHQDGDSCPMTALYMVNAFCTTNTNESNVFADAPTGTTTTLLPSQNGRRTWFQTKWQNDPSTDDEKMSTVAFGWASSLFTRVDPGTNAPAPLRVPTLLLQFYDSVQQLMPKNDLYVIQRLLDPKDSGNIPKETLSVPFAEDFTAVLTYLGETAAEMARGPKLATDDSTWQFVATLETNAFSDALGLLESMGNSLSRRLVAPLVAVGANSDEELLKNVDRTSKNAILKNVQRASLLAATWIEQGLPKTPPREDLLNLRRELGNAQYAPLVNKFVANTSLADSQLRLKGALENLLSKNPPSSSSTAVPSVSSPKKGTVPPSPSSSSSGSPSSRPPTPARASAHSPQTSAFIDGLQLWEKKLVYSKNLAADFPDEMKKLERGQFESSWFLKNVHSNVFLELKQLFDMFKEEKKKLEAYNAFLEGLKQANEVVSGLPAYITVAFPDSYHAARDQVTREAILAAAKSGSTPTLGNERWFLTSKELHDMRIDSERFADMTQPLMSQDWENYGISDMADFITNQLKELNSKIVTFQKLTPDVIANAENNGVFSLWVENLGAGAIEFRRKWTKEIERYSLISDKVLPLLQDRIVYEDETAMVDVIISKALTQDEQKEVPALLQQVKDLFDEDESFAGSLVSNGVDLLELSRKVYKKFNALDDKGRVGWQKFVLKKKLIFKEREAEKLHASKKSLLSTSKRMGLIAALVVKGILANKSDFNSRVTQEDQKPLEEYLKARLEAAKDTQTQGGITRIQKIVQDLSRPSPYQPPAPPTGSFSWTVPGVFPARDAYDDRRRRREKETPTIATDFNDMVDMTRYTDAAREARMQREFDRREHERFVKMTTDFLVFQRWETMSDEERARYPNLLRR